MAVVLSVTHKGQPIQDATKLQRLQQMLFDMMDQKHQGIVTIKTVSSCARSPLNDGCDLKCKPHMQTCPLGVLCKFLGGSNAAADPSPKQNSDADGM